MLSPTTTTMAFRLAGHGTPRAALLTPLNKSTHPSCPLATTWAPFKTQSHQMSILASSSPLSCLRPTSSSPVSKSTSATPSTTTTTLALLRFRRCASTTPSPGVTPDGTQRLDWNTFFKLRKARRRWQVAFSAVAMVASGAGGAVFLSTGAADPVLTQVPLDPFITLGLMVLGFSALGWLAGPSLGSAVFNVLNRQWKKQMTMVRTLVNPFSSFLFFFFVSLPHEWKWFEAKLNDIANIERG